MVRARSVINVHDVECGDHREHLGPASNIKAERSVIEIGKNIGGVVKLSKLSIGHLT